LILTVETLQLKPVEMQPLKVLLRMFHELCQLRNYCFVLCANHDARRQVNCFVPILFRGYHECE
jgi:hypothetical protein